MANLHRTGQSHRSGGMITVALVVAFACFCGCQSESPPPTDTAEKKADAQQPKDSPVLGEQQQIAYEPESTGSSHQTDPTDAHHSHPNGHDRQLGQSGHHGRQHANHQQSEPVSSNVPQTSQPSHRPPTEVASDNDNLDALAVFNKRILPIMKSSNPSSCAECHLSGVDLKDYIGADQQQTFAALRERGLIDVEHPGESKILKFIARKPDKPSLITDKVRLQELRAFQAWIEAAVDDPQLLKATANNEPLGAKLPVEVIRHARKDRVLASFIDNIWTEIARCSGCHSPRFNQKQVKEHGEQVSWIQPHDPQETLTYLVDAELIDTERPEKSLLLMKPTMQVKHGGGQKMVVGDRSYKQFRRFIDDYAAVVNGRYTAADELPEPEAEISVATSMRNGIWLKFRGLPKRFDKMLLQVDLYRRDGRRNWSKFRWATADRPVAGDRGVWQQSLTLTAPRKSRRAAELRHARKLPPGVYLAKVYIDRTGKLQADFRTELNQDDFIGEVVIDSRWPAGYGRMTVVDFRRVATSATAE